MKIIVIVLSLLVGYLIWRGWSATIIGWFQDPVVQAPASQAPPSPAPAPQPRAAEPPKAPAAPVKQAAPAGDPLQVSGIVDGDPPMAIVGDQAVSAGDRVGEYEVLEIGADFVKYRGPGGKTVVKKISKEKETMYAED